MPVETIIKVLAGAAAGAGVGYLLSRIRNCSGDACRVRPVTWFWMLGGAVFGAGVAYAVLTS